MTVDAYSFLSEYKTRTAELQDIAAMDRLAAELAPPSALRRWAQQRRTAREDAAAQPARRLPRAGRPHHV